MPVNDTLACQKSVSIFNGACSWIVMTNLLMLPFPRQAFHLMKQHQAVEIAKVMSKRSAQHEQKVSTVQHTMSKRSAPHLQQHHITCITCSMRLSCRAGVTCCPTTSPITAATCRAPFGQSVARLDMGSFNLSGTVARSLGNLLDLQVINWVNNTGDASAVAIDHLVLGGLDMVMFLPCCALVACFYDSKARTSMQGQAGTIQLQLHGLPDLNPPELRRPADEAEYLVAQQWGIGFRHRSGNCTLGTFASRAHSHFF